MLSIAMLTAGVEGLEKMITKNCINYHMILSLFGWRAHKAYMIMTGLDINAP